MLVGVLSELEELEEDDEDEGGGSEGWMVFPAASFATIDMTMY
jgi:hypothetical protein